MNIQSDNQSDLPSVSETRTSQNYGDSQYKFSGSKTALSPNSVLGTRIPYHLDFPRSATDRCCPGVTDAYHSLTRSIWEGSEKILELCIAKFQMMFYTTDEFLLS